MRENWEIKQLQKFQILQVLIYINFMPVKHKN